MTGVTFYHRTDAARAILDGGFRDATGSYMFARITLTGVWLADQPLDSNEGAKGNDLLEVTMPDEMDLSGFEIVGDNAGYREWCVPAALINRHGTVRQVGPAEEDEISWQRQAAAFRARPELLAEILDVAGDHASGRLLALAQEIL